MEALVFHDSPLAEYLEGHGDGGEASERTPSVELDVPWDGSSPSFAPRGRPTVRPKFRPEFQPPLRLSAPQHTAVAVAAIHNTCSKAVNSRLGRADNARFLERFRYIIVASRLLNAHSYIGQALHGQSQELTVQAPEALQLSAITLVGAAVTSSMAFALAWLTHWTRSHGSPSARRGRMAILLFVIILVVAVSYAHMRRQWLQYLRQQSLAEISGFAAKAQRLDSAIGAALTLVQEVELVSRGYRLSTPLPPVSRIEERCQTRRCARLRKQLLRCFSAVIPRYNQACVALKLLAEELDLEKYFDIYDINDSDFSDAMAGFSEKEFEDAESVRVLKILAARFCTSRTIFLCCLMALDADGAKPDFDRWSTAVEQIQGVALVTGDAEDRLRRILSEEENFSISPTPQVPTTPGRERCRAQLRKLNSLSTGIRGLQAKLHVLREESNTSLEETDDVSEVGTNLMIQYESIGVDLKSLMHEWEEGKAALASNIGRNERRVSSISGMLSPTTSLGGLTAVEEGSASDALKALNGETRSRNSMDFSSSDAEEVFEAVAIPRQRPRSTLSREERILRMKEDRAKRDSVKSKAEANTKMLRELESVINMRPRGRTAAGGRITSI
ncbi:hypothetical protein MBM_01430 [Drepanopeziza brunnea f. sp. 'multigermtubi' MB_m1]|uniref:Vezatin n=1 Tax=Marssonina brunnea f. sp. multigermtubi (strain MB_m1) TaxID=1072389 RepID=K1XJ82_MARBU|nr:uncharacterized protein MBM_01430 [Drepanopeziza brunnea f. sp. 'multigermtubi' MB_m1]EKD20748.1 hypothetical protein MBM_01430 [Drepanopeziza brunnea f. sp. 'multigermtubi' MB_m1]